MTLCPRNRDLHGLDFEVEICPYIDKFRPSKCGLHGHISWIRSNSGESSFDPPRICLYMRQIRGNCSGSDGASRPTLEIASTRGDFEESRKARNARGWINPRAKFARAGQISSKIRNANFSILFAIVNRFQNSEFQNFWNIGESDQNWCSNCAQFRQLYSTSEFFEISNFKNSKIISKLSAVRGKLISPILKFLTPLRVVLLWTHRFKSGKIEFELCSLILSLEMCPCRAHFESRKLRKLCFRTAKTTRDESLFKTHEIWPYRPHFIRNFSALVVEKLGTTFTRSKISKREIYFSFARVSALRKFAV